MKKLLILPFLKTQHYNGLLQVLPAQSPLRRQAVSAKRQPRHNKTLCIGINSIYRPRGPYVHLLVSGLLQHIPSMNHVFYHVDFYK